MMGMLHVHVDAFDDEFRRRQDELKEEIGGGKKNKKKPVTPSGDEPADEDDTLKDPEDTELLGEPLGDIDEKEDDSDDEE